MGDHYGWRGDGLSVPKDLLKKAEDFPQLRPYKSLDAGRLKLSGKGMWPLQDFLDGPLWLPYVEPAFLLHHESINGLPVPALHLEDQQEYERLAWRWEELGLLRLHEAPYTEGAYVRVFNCHKTALCDRQIGDRRFGNHSERHLGGPSRHLPQTPLLTALHVAPGGGLRGSVTDRRDFYHQCRVTSERAASNLVPFSFPVECFRNTSALEELAERRRGEKVRDRDVAGDKLGMEIAVPKDLEGLAAYPAFGALYQGDHLGVEFALGGHEGLLCREGLLLPHQRLQGRALLPWSSTWQALIIDDFFVVSHQDCRCPKEDSEAFGLLQKARAAYKKHELEGSEEKDVVAEDLFKAGGAEVDSREDAFHRGLALVSAPLAKRIGLSTLSLRIARLPALTTTLASRLTGSWVSVLLYRRCFAAVVDELFGIGKKNPGTEAEELVPMSPGVAEELQMLAVFAPWISSNLKVSYSKTLFATDASMEKGAIVETEVSGEEAKALWLGGDRKGNYVLLDNPFRQILRHLDELDDAEDDFAPNEPEIASPQKEWPFEFDFVELCGGVGEISKAMARRGAVVAPVLDLSFSRQYNLKNIRFLEWFLWMVREKRFKSVFLAPPCTTFSAAAHPQCRSYKVPEGFNRRMPKVLHGNILAFYSLTIFKHCVMFSTYAGFEQPRRSKMAWLRAWRGAVQRGAEEAVMAGCQFGSIHKKEFRILLNGIPADELEAKCRGGHTHVRIEGAYTKLSAIYPEKMAEKIAEVFLRHARMRQIEECESPPPIGRESLIVNDLLIAREWTERRSWHWRKRSHINVLETSSAVSVLREQAVREPSSRQNVIVDSEVAKGSLSKGRSSSFSLRPVLKRSAAIQIAGDVYPAFCYGPTRINTADAPTRNRPLPVPSPYLLLDFFQGKMAYELHSTKLCRFQANWMRLTLLLCCSHGFTVAEATCFSSTSHWFIPVYLPLRSFVVWTFSIVVSVWISCLLKKGLGGSVRRILVVFLLILVVSPAYAPMVPLTSCWRQTDWFEGRLGTTDSR